MQIPMGSIKHIESIFDLKTAEYVLRKNRGGRNAARGIDFETVFAITKIGELVHELVSGNEDLTITKQALEFVDDIQFHSHTRKDDYQLKDALRVSWSGRKAQIRNDFIDQQRLNLEHHRCESTQHLVVSRDELATKLKSTMPKKISPHSRIEVFPPTGDSANALLITSPRVRAAIAEACCSPDEADKLEAVFGALFSAWGTVPPTRPISLAEVLEQARKFSNYLRVIQNVPPLPEDIEIILKGIDGLHFEIFRGFFRWQYRRADSGVLSYSCLDLKFHRFLAHLRRSIPTSFESLEPLLLC